MAHCVDYFRINDFIKPVQACTIGPGRPAEPIRHTVAAGRHLWFRRRPDMTSLKVAPHPVYLDPYQIWWRSAQPRPSYDHFCIFKMAARRHVGFYCRPDMTSPEVAAGAILPPYQISFRSGDQRPRYGDPKSQNGDPPPSWISSAAGCDAVDRWRMWSCTCVLSFVAIGCVLATQLKTDNKNKNKNNKNNNQSSLAVRDPGRVQ